MTINIPDERLWADDPDVARTWPIYDHDLTDPIAYTVTVRIDDDATTDRAGVWVGDTTTTTWRGRAATTRLLRVPLTSLEPGSHMARAVVTSGNDINLGSFYLH